MTLMPRRPRASWPSGPRGSRFHPPFPMAHQHRRSQEGTLNVSRKFILLGLFAVLAAAFATVQYSGVAQALTSASKTCTRASSTSATCTLTVSGVTAGTVATVTLSSSPAGATYTSVLLTASSGNVTVTNTGTTITIDCTGPLPGNCSATISETISIGSAATTLAQLVTEGDTSILATATVPAVAPAGPSATKTCTATGPASASCTLTVSFSTPLPAVPPITTVTVSLTAPAGATLALTGASLTPSACGIASVAGNVVTISSPPGGCTSVAISETVTGLPINATSTISQSATLAGGDTGTVTASATVTTALGMSVACSGNVSSATTLSQINSFATTPVAAVSTVPNVIGCTITLSGLDAGVLEISSVHGLLASSSGTLSSNLRIPCGTIGVAGSCTGTVSFVVAAGGVGFVPVQVRYEPAPLSTTTERETSVLLAFIAPPVGISLSLNPNPIAVGQRGTATLGFFVGVSCAGAAPTATIISPVTGTAVTACVDPATGTFITSIPSSSVLSGTVLFSIDNTAIARWTGAPVSGSPITTPPAAGAAPSVTGFTTSANQVAVRCGFFPTLANPNATAISSFFLPFPAALSQFFGGCQSAQAQYEGVAPGAAVVSAQFIPDLPGGLAPIGFIGGAQFNPLFGNFVGATNLTSTRTLEVTGAAPRVDLARGCNNVSPTVTEAAADYAKRVSPAGALVAIWEHQAATNTFRGWSPAAGAPSDLAQVTRLRPVFICVSGPATLDQPAS